MTNHPSQSRRRIWLGLTAAGIVGSFLLGMIVHFLILHTGYYRLAVLTVREYRTRLTSDYDRPVAEAMVRAFGAPVETGKRDFARLTARDRMFLGTNRDDYPWASTLKAQKRYFLDKARHAPPLSSGREIDAARVLRDHFGVREFDLSAIDAAARTPVENSPLGTVERVDIAFDHGALVQFLLARPPRERDRGAVLVAIHGCSGSPDSVMGLTGPSAANEFGREALRRGYTVVAPFILNRCDWIDDFDFIGGLAGMTALGYETTKVLLAARWAEEEFRPAAQIIWGISLGGQVGALASVLHPFDTTVIDGGMVMDYRDWHIRTFLETGLGSLGMEASRMPDLERILPRRDIHLAILPRRIIVPIASFDAFADVGAIQDLVNEARARFGRTDLVEVLFFRGFHETFPAGVLDRLDRAHPKPASAPPAAGREERDADRVHDPDRVPPVVPFDSALR